MLVDDTWHFECHCINIAYSTYSVHYITLNQKPPTTELHRIHIEFHELNFPALSILFLCALNFEMKLNSISQLQLLRTTEQIDLIEISR